MYVPASCGTKNSSPSGLSVNVERVDGLSLRLDDDRLLGDEQRVVVWVGVVGQHVERDRLADHGDRRVVAGVWLVVGVVEADRTR